MIEINQIVQIVDLTVDPTTEVINLEVSETPISIILEVKETASPAVIVIEIAENVTVGLDNIPKFITFSSNSTNTTPVHTRINQMDTFEMLGVDVFFVKNVIYNLDDNVPPNRIFFKTEKYVVTNVGKGFYGIDGTQLEAANVELIYSSPVTTSDIINIPLTQILIIEDLLGLSVSNYINQLIPSFEFQEVDIAPRIIQAIGVADYLFLPPGGMYGLADNQTTNVDFQALNSSPETPVTTLGDILLLGNRQPKQITGPTYNLQTEDKSKTLIADQSDTIIAMNNSVFNIGDEIEIINPANTNLFFASYLDTGAVFYLGTDIGGFSANVLIAGSRTIIKCIAIDVYTLNIINSISIGTTPNFQQVTDVEDPITTNPVGSTSAFYVGAFIDWLSGNTAASFMAMYADMGLVIKDYGPKAPMIFKNKLNDNTITLLAQNKPESDYLIADTEDIAALQTQIANINTTVLQSLEGLSWKNNARIAIDTNVASSGQILSIASLVQQGITLVNNDRILFTGMTNTALNGLYRLNSANMYLYRTTDANLSTELTNALVPVAEGTYQGKVFRQTTVNPVIYTTPIVFEIFGNSVAIATALVSGIMKLYTAAGTNTDGTISQKIITDLLALKEDLTNKENTTLDNSSTKYPTNNLVKTYLDEDLIIDKFLNNQLAYIIPAIGSGTFGSLRVGNITISGQVAYSGQPTAIQFSTTVVPGTIAAVRGVNINIGSTYFVSKIYFKIITNIAGTRFFNGYSNMFRLALPTNVEPDTLINSMGVCKLSTSDNLHFIYNDASGLATTIDLGVNFPATSVGDYSYTLEFIRRTTDTNVTMTLVRNDGLTTSTVISSNIPTSFQSHAIYITNNATASIASFLHHGAAYNTLT